MEASVTQRLRVLRADSIKIKILVLAVLATLLPSLATTSISYFENRRSLDARASEALRSASAQSVREVDLWLKERRYELRVFASSYEVTENLAGVARPGAESPEQRLGDYLNSVRERFSDYDELLVMKPDGRIVASSGGQARSIELPAGWQAELRGDGLVLGPPYRDASGDRREMLIAVPIVGSGASLLGTIAAEVKLDALGATLRNFAPADSGRVSLLTPAGDLLASSDDSLAASDVSPYALAASGLDAMSDGQPAELSNDAGEAFVASIERVPGPGWVVLAEIPSAEVFAQLSHLRNVTLGIVLATLILVGGLGYALGAFIVRPLDRLTKAAAKVAAGDLDLDVTAAKGGEVGYLTEVFRDMVARLRASRLELERLSVTDPLTGLDNRRRMMESLQNEVLRSRRLRHSFAVLMVDVDHFKDYNDRFGHPAGDEVLRNVAGLLRKSTRDVDRVARYGGEEFFVLMPETKARDAARVADKIRRRLVQEPIGEAAVSLSFGVAEFPTHGDSGDVLIEVADAALYEAKRAGRDRVVVAEASGRIRAAGE